MEDYPCYNNNKNLYKPLNFNINEFSPNRNIFSRNINYNNNNNLARRNNNMNFENNINNNNRNMRNKYSNEINNDYINYQYRYNDNNFNLDKNINLKNRGRNNFIHLKNENNINRNIFNPINNKNKFYITEDINNKVNNNININSNNNINFSNTINYNKINNNFNKKQTDRINSNFLCIKEKLKRMPESGEDDKSEDESLSKIADDLYNIYLKNNNQNNIIINNENEKIFKEINDKNSNNNILLKIKNNKLNGIKKIDFSSDIETKCFQSIEFKSFKNKRNSNSPKIDKIIKKTKKVTFDLKQNYYFNYLENDMINFCQVKKGEEASLENFEPKFEEINLNQNKNIISCIKPFNKNDIKINENYRSGEYLEEYEIIPDLYEDLGDDINILGLDSTDNFVQSLRFDPSDNINPLNEIFNINDENNDDDGLELSLITLNDGSTTCTTDNSLNES